MTEPEFETGRKLYSYNVVSLGLGRWEVEGECDQGNFKVVYQKGDQYLTHVNVRCLNWTEVSD